MIHDYIHQEADLPANPHHASKVYSTIPCVRCVKNGGPNGKNFKKSLFANTRGEKVEWICNTCATELHIVP